MRDETDINPEINEPEGKNPQREWTLMFYFASDNPLAISIVSQLKALKAAGYHPQANVIAQFDPFTEGTPTHIFDVNVIDKLKDPDKPNIGFAPDTPFVRTLLEDKLWRDQKTHEGKSIRSELRKAFSQLPKPILYQPAVPPNGRTSNGTNGTNPVVQNGGAVTGLAKGGNGTNGSNGQSESRELNPQDSLNKFLDFCATKYPAKHYMLFILGHGVVVGNDMFLFDEHADVHTLKLSQLSKELDTFKTKIEALPQPAVLELISFHSCSVSSLEVAYELEGKAKYMLASQGPTFVGSWPYRQILLRIFKDIEAKTADAKDTFIKIFYYCLFNSTDYLLAGYSHQLTLCDLTQLGSLKEPLSRLTRLITEGVKDPSIADYIQLAHLKSQSYFQEMYTDLYDFCYCLSGKLQESLQPKEVLSGVKLEIYNRCDEVMRKLVPEDRRMNPNGTGTDKPIILRSEFVGPSYQYSHGLSVYFPWSQPSEDREVMSQYKDYKFTTQFTDPWFKFLNTYFEETMRTPSTAEPDPRRSPLNTSVTRDLQEEAASLLFVGDGPFGNDSTLALAKDDPRDRTGGECDCPSIKNYPRDTRRRRTRRSKVTQPLPMGNFDLTDQSFVV